jgi:hypothetical protein
MKPLLSLCLIVVVSTAAFAADSTVQLERRDDTIGVTIDNRELAVYHFGGDLRKPYFWPVRGPDGTVLTRELAGSDSDRKTFDHPHQKGLWVSVDEVNGTKFWVEQGKIEATGVKIIQASGNPAKFEVTNQWKQPDGTLAVTETTTISIFANRLMVYDIRFQAGARKVTFEDTKEGFLGFRMVDSMREKEGGRVVNADGVEGSAACWGREADWVDYYGQADGKTFGVALFDDPNNFRPARYHVRDYGLFAISPFGPRAYSNNRLPAETVTLEPGKSLSMRYGVYIHTGNTKSAEVAEVYAQFVKLSDESR